MGFFSGFGAGMLKAAPLINESDRVRTEQKRLEDEMLTAALQRQLSQSKEARDAQMFIQDLLAKKQTNEYYPKMQDSQLGLNQSNVDVNTQNIVESKQAAALRKLLEPSQLAAANVVEKQSNFQASDPFMAAWGQGQIDATKTAGKQNAMYAAQAEKASRWDTNEVAVPEIKRLLAERANLPDTDPKAAIIDDRLQRLMAPGKNLNSPQSVDAVKADLLNKYVNGQLTPAQKQAFNEYMGAGKPAPKGVDREKQMNTQLTRKANYASKMEAMVNGAMAHQMKSVAPGAKFNAVALKQQIRQQLAAKDPDYQALQAALDDVQAKIEMLNLPDSPEDDPTGRLNTRPDTGQFRGGMVYPPGEVNPEIASKADKYQLKLKGNRANTQRIVDATLQSRPF